MRVPTGSDTGTWTTVLPDCTSAVTRRVRGGRATSSPFSSLTCSSASSESSGISESIFAVFGNDDEVGGRRRAPNGGTAYCSESEPFPDRDRRGHKLLPTLRKTLENFYSPPPDWRRRTRPNDTTTTATTTAMDGRAQSALTHALLLPFHSARTHRETRAKEGEREKRDCSTTPKCDFTIPQNLEQKQQYSHKVTLCRNFTQTIPQFNALFPKISSAFHSELARTLFSFFSLCI